MANPIKILYSKLFGLKNKSKIILKNNGAVIVNSKCVYGGRVIRRNNTVEISERCHIRGCSFEFYGNNNKIVIKRGCILTNVQLYVEGENSTIVIGEGTTMAGTNRGVVHLAAMEGKTLSVGKECMFADDISVRTGDSHPIKNSDGEIINPGRDVTICDGVCVGTGCLIMKGAVIPKGCVLGARSLLNKAMEKENCCIVGQPARVVKENISWSR